MLSNSPVPPVVNSVSPNNFLLLVNTTLTITGRNFQAGSEVRIGGLVILPGQVTVVNSNTITVQVGLGLGLLGTLDVIVKSPSGLIGTLLNGLKLL